MRLAETLWMGLDCCAEAATNYDHHDFGSGTLDGL